MLGPKIRTVAGAGKPNAQGCTFAHPIFRQVIKKFEVFFFSGHILQLWHIQFSTAFTASKMKFVKSQGDVPLVSCCLAAFFQILLGLQTTDKLERIEKPAARPTNSEIRQHKIM